MEDTLFTGDEVFEEQMDLAEQYEKQNDIKKFIGYKLLNSCQNCQYQSNSSCSVMRKYKQIDIAVCNLGKYRHWKEKVDE